MKKESNIKNQILLDLGKRDDVMIWNNPTGVFQTQNGQYVRCGMPGQPDLIAIVRKKITPEMVGKEIGVFVAIETKTKAGRQREEQKDWQSACSHRGAVYSLIRSPEEAQKLISEVQNA